MRLFHFSDDPNIEVFTPRAVRVELRVMESLTPLRGVWETSLHASGIRLRHAQGWDS